MPWPRTLAELRPHFQAHTLADLHYLEASRWRSLDEVRHNPIFDQYDILCFQSDEPWRAGKPILSDRHVSRACFRDGRPYRPLPLTEPEGYEWTRRVYFGEADDATLDHFRDLANRAGRCVRCFTRNTIRSEDDSQVWMDYVVFLARLGVKGCPLMARAFALSQLPPDGYYVALPTNVFDASVLAIDAILTNVASLTDASGDVRLNPAPEAIPACPEAPAPDGTSVVPAGQTLSAENRALAVALKRTKAGESMSITQIAREARCSASYLYRCKSLMEFIDTQQRTIPRGWKDAKTRGMESYRDHDEE